MHITHRLARLFLRRKCRLAPKPPSLARVQGWVRQLDWLRRCAQADKRYNLACHYRDRMEAAQERLWELLEEQDG